MVKRNIQKYAAVIAEKMADFEAERQKHSAIYGSERIYLSVLSDLLDLMDELHK